MALGMGSRGAGLSHTAQEGAVGVELRHCNQDFEWETQKSGSDSRNLCVHSVPLSTARARGLITNMGLFFGDSAGKGEERKALRTPRGTLLLPSFPDVVV